MCSLEKGWFQFILSWVLWFIFIISFYNYFVERAMSTEIGKAQVHIIERMTWKDILANKSFCEYSEWHEIAIKTGDIANCK